MYRREASLIEKYKQAEEVRNLRYKHREHSLVDQYKERLQEMKAVEKVAELEIQAKIAWRFRETRKTINAQKKALDGKIQAEILRLKIKKDLDKQGEKIIRSERAAKPRAKVLPYLKNQDSLESSESSKEIIEVYIPKKKLIGRISSNFQSPVKDVMFRYNVRHMSPDVKKVKF